MRRIVLAALMILAAGVLVGGIPASADHVCAEDIPCPPHDLPPTCDQAAAKPCLPPSCPEPHENQAYDVCVPDPLCLFRTDCCPPQAFWCPEPETESAVASPCYPEEPCDPPPHPLPCYPIGKLCIPVPPCIYGFEICLPPPCPQMAAPCMPDPCMWMSDCCPPSFVCWDES